MVGDWLTLWQASIQAVASVDDLSRSQRHGTGRESDGWLLHCKTFSKAGSSTRLELFRSIALDQVGTSASQTCGGTQGRWSTSRSRRVPAKRQSGKSERVIDFSYLEI